MNEKLISIAPLNLQGSQSNLRLRLSAKMLTNHTANFPDISKNNCISITFPEEYSGFEGESSCSYRLLEVSDPHLMSTLENKKDMWIRGGKDDDAVLCTENQTFRLREMVTSNMFLVVDKSDCGNKGTIVGRPSATLEATVMSRPPGIDQLLKALNESPYDGGIDEEFSGNDSLNVVKIYENIQASSKEIEECVKEQGAMIISGTINFI